jgi:hypothetical protein
MATEYTDVDRLILSRWNDVMGLFEAHEELQDRIEEVIDDVAARLTQWLDTRGYDLISCDAKAASIDFGKTDWHHKKKDGWAVYFQIGEFAPIGFRKVRDDHPYCWLQTENLEFLRMKEPERIAFAKALRQELGDGASKWANTYVKDTESPLGRHFTDISDRDRVDFVTDPDKLFDFAKRASEELFTLADPIDRVLAKFRPKE